jgi:hypothetical protein
VIGGGGPVAAAHEFIERRWILDGGIPVDADEKPQIVDGDFNRCGRFVDPEAADCVGNGSFDRVARVDHGLPSDGRVSVEDQQRVGSSQWNPDDESRLSADAADKHAQAVVFRRPERELQPGIA